MTRGDFSGNFSCFDVLMPFFFLFLFVCFGLFTGDLGGTVSFKNWFALWGSRSKCDLCINAANSCSFD